MLKMTIGSAWGHRFSFYKEDRSTPLDLTQLTIKAIIKKEKEDADTTVVLPTQTFTNQGGNDIIVQYTATATAYLNEGNYYFAIKIYTEDDLDRELYNDILTVSRGVFYD